MTTFQLTQLQAALLFEALPTDEELRLLRRDVQGMLDSFAYPKGTADADQPTEWHHARLLMGLVKRLERAKRAFKNDQSKVAANEPRDCPMCGAPASYGHVCPEHSD